MVIFLVRKIWTWLQLPSVKILGLEAVRIDSSVQPFVSEMPDRGCPTEFEV